MSASLATGLYSVHCLIPPHPGAAAAAGIFGVDLGRLIIFGVLVAIPATLTGYAWTKFAARKMHFENSDSFPITETPIAAPLTFMAFLPVIVPILLIASRSLFSLEKLNASTLSNIIQVLGDPVIALSIGIILAILSKKTWSSKEL